MYGGIGNDRNVSMHKYKRHELIVVFSRYMVMSDV